MAHLYNRRYWVPLLVNKEEVFATGAANEVDVFAQFDVAIGASDE